MKLKTYGIKHKEHGLLGFSLHTELWGSLECGADAILVVELEENKSGYYMTWHIQAEEPPNHIIDKKADYYKSNIDHPFYEFKKEDLSVVEITIRC
jgi:hypothetical protein